MSALRAANGFGPGDDVGFAAHLRTLVPALHELRASYRSGWGSVAVTYTRAVTEAYMLAYFPHYVRLSATALGVLPEGALSASRRLRVCAFASGPAPEPVAVAHYLTTNGYETETLALALLDIVPERWEWARSVSIDRILPAYWDRDVQVARTDAVDITAPELVSNVEDIVDRADLVLFQNCLNEFPADQAYVEANAEELLDTMKPGALLLMADLNNYPTGRACLDIFERIATRDAELLHSAGEVLAVGAAPGRPAILDQHFFLDGEYPRVRPFEFRCLAARAV